MFTDIRAKGKADVVIFTAPMHLVPASHTNYS